MENPCKEPYLKKKHIIHIFRPILLLFICPFPWLTFMILMASVKDVFPRAKGTVSQASLVEFFAAFSIESKEIDSIATRCEKIFLICYLLCFETYFRFTVKACRSQLISINYSKSTMYLDSTIRNGCSKFRLESLYRNNTSSHAILC